MNRGQVAAKVAANKEKHPELYCAVKGCLWRVGGTYGTPCKKHPVITEAAVEQVLNAHRNDLLAAGFGEHAALALTEQLRVAIGRMEA